MNLSFVLALLVATTASESPAVELSPHLLAYQGPINVGIVRDGPRALLVDCGDGSVAEHLKRLGVTAVEQVLFTHHHRDQACGAWRFQAAGARLVVPAAEQSYFDRVADYWNGRKSRWNLYNFHPHHLMLAEPVRVDATATPGQTIAWGPAKIQVLETPGHTDGSVTYLIDVDGRRTAFSGDAIYDQGQVWDISSLQKGTQTTDYHGYLGTRPQLKASMERIRQSRPQVLVPSHGRILREPDRAIASLCARLDQCYDKYVAISALRHYFPKLFVDYAGRADHMPIRPGKAAPDCLRHVGTSWIVVSRNKAAFVMDCGSPRVVDALKQMLAKGEIRSVEGLWVTHYHDDHVEAIPQFQKAFPCPCMTDQGVAQVITDPLAWRLPCISASRARVDRPTRDGETWTWQEFKLTAYSFPGQTLYHAGLLVEGQGVRMFFVGDSFTMAGIDDYCPQNRNPLGAGLGFDRCVTLLDRLRPTHLFNCHVNDAFDFTAEECRFMRANLAEREKLFGQLLPWDHPNYGTDDSWVRAFPYEQEQPSGAMAVFSVVLTNYSSAPREAQCRAVLPRSWATEPTAWKSASIPARHDGQIPVAFRVPPTVAPGRYVIPIDVRYDRWVLPQWTEAVLVVHAPAKHLVLDARVVDRVDGLRLVPGRVEKDPHNPLFQADRPWENALNNLYPNVVYDAQEQRYKLWYKCVLSDADAIARMSPPRTVHKVGWYLCYATSADGIHWEKPELGLHAFGGSKRTNIVARDTPNAGVFRDDYDRNPARRYKMIFDVGWNEMRVCFSPDGIHWSAPVVPEGLPQCGDTHNNAFWDPAAERYVLFTRIFRGERLVYRSESDDFFHWSPPALALRSTLQEGKARQAYCMSVFPYAGMYLGLVMMYNSAADRTVDCELAASPDSRQWTRPWPGQPLISRGGPDAYDAGCIYAQAGVPRLVDGKLMIFYGGSQAVHRGWKRHCLPCLARLRADGFAGYRPDEGRREGLLVTQPLRLTGTPLSISADAAGGRIRVSVVDAAGFGLEQCTPIAADVTDAPVAWQGRDLASLAGHTVRLKFEIQNATLYGFGL
jgi:glyoxylase-like metal-dependent hydrolase (beta-lactamase superfamily II)